MSLKESRAMLARFKDRLPLLGAKSSEETYKKRLAKIKRVLIIHTLWYPEVVDGLKESALDFLYQQGLKKEQVFDYAVPGAFEMPLGLRKHLPCDFAIVLGCVVRGETPHFDFICQSTTLSLQRLSVDTATPLGFGLLTVNNLEQALARKDKGAEAAHAALMQYLS